MHGYMCINTTQARVAHVSDVGVNLHVNEIAPSVSDSNRVRPADAIVDVCVCVSADSVWVQASRLVCVVFSTW